MKDRADPRRAALWDAIDGYARGTLTDTEVDHQIDRVIRATSVEYEAKLSYSHRCKNPPGSWSIWDIRDCDECLLIVVAGMPNNGYTEDKLARLLTHFRGSHTHPGDSENLPESTPEDRERVHSIVKQMEARCG